MPADSGVAVVCAFAGLIIPRRYGDRPDTVQPINRVGDHRCWSVRQPVAGESGVLAFYVITAWLPATTICRDYQNESSSALFTLYAAGGWSYTRSNACILSGSNSISRNSTSTVNVRHDRRLSGNGIARPHRICVAPVPPRTEVVCHFDTRFAIAQYRPFRKSSLRRRVRCGARPVMWLWPVEFAEAEQSAGDHVGSCRAEVPVQTQYYLPPRNGSFTMAYSAHGRAWLCAAGVTHALPCIAEQKVLIAPGTPKRWW